MGYYLAIKKEWNLAIRSNMDGPRGYYAKWNKSDRESQILYVIIYMWNLNKTKQNKTNRLIDTENKLVVARGEEIERTDKIGKGN